MREEERIVIDESTLKQLYDLYVDPLTLFLSHYTRNQHKIEDVIQDVFIKIWEDRETVSIFYIKTYLYTAAKNRMLSELRNEKNRLAHLENWANEIIAKKHAEDCVDVEEFRPVYEQAIQQLPEKCRDIYLLSREQEKSYKEIAEIKNISIKTVENQISIALKKIKSYVQAFYLGSVSNIPILIFLSHHFF